MENVVDIKCMVKRSFCATLHQIRALENFHPFQGEGEGKKTNGQRKVTGKERKIRGKGCRGKGEDEASREVNGEEKERTHVAERTPGYCQLAFSTPRHSCVSSNPTTSVVPTDSASHLPFMICSLVVFTLGKVMYTLTG